MAVGFRSTATSRTASNATLTLAATKPTGVVEGDVLIAFATVGDTGATEPTFTPPSGWTAIRSQVDYATGPTNYIKTVAYWKLATNSEPSTYTFTTSVATSSRFAVIINAYTGVNGTNPIGSGEVNGDSVVPNSTARATGAITLAAKRWVVAAVSDRGNSTFTTPAGLTARASTNGQTPSMAVFDSNDYVSSGTVSYQSESSVSSSTSNGIIFSLVDGGTVPYIPTVGGSSSFRNAAAGSVPVNISAVPVGGWMVVSAMISAGSPTVTAPAGWTTLHALEVTGTRRNVAFGKIKESSDGSTANFNQNASNTTAYGFIWGTGSQSISNWIIGAVGLRANSGEASGARYTNIAPSVTSTQVNSLVLAVSHEATLAMTASYEITSRTSGWAENLWLPQVAPSDQIETIWMGTKALSAPSASGNMSIVYMSQVDSNGWSFQVVIPGKDPIEIADPPYVVSSSEVIGAGSGATIVFNKPSGLQNGDMLMVVLRGQSNAAAYDWTSSGGGWTRVGPAWPGASSLRLNTQFVRLVTDAAGEPSTYTFTKTTVDSNRRMGQIILIRSDHGEPTAYAWDSVYGGEDPAGAVDRAPVPYAIVTPALEVLWGASEFASPNDHAITTYPSGYTTIRYSTTDSNTAVSRTVIYTGYRTYLTGSTTIQAGPDWSGTTAGASAGSVTFITIAESDPAGEGFALHDGAGDEVRVFYTEADGPRTPENVVPVIRGFNSVSDMLAKPGFTWAHRGGSASWPECSLYAFTRSVVRGYGVLEVSLGRTSDGVWFGLHDQTTDRTSGGTYGDASSQTWAQIQTQQIVVGAEGAPQPYMRWEEIVAAYGSTHILVVDPKYGFNTYRTEFLNMVNNDVGPTRAIIKFSGVGSGAAALSNAARALGFETWGYYYAGDASAANGGNGALQTWQSNWTILGMEYTASQPIWDEITAIGKPVVGHIAPNQTAYNTAMTKGASGVQVSGVGVVAPVSWWTP